MKRILTFVLAILFLLSLAACSPKPTYEDEELARAVELGIGEYRGGNPVVTYAEFMTMLDNALKRIDETKLAGWQELLPEARASKAEMTRADAMCAVFSLAEYLGGDYWRMNDEDTVRHDVPAPWETGEWQPNNDYWGDLMRFPMNFDEWTEPGDSNFGGTAYFYSIERISSRSGESLFDFDEEKQSMRCTELMTHEEALRAALRFYEAK